MTFVKYSHVCIRTDAVCIRNGWKFISQHILTNSIRFLTTISTIYTHTHTHSFYLLVFFLLFLYLLKCIQLFFIADNLYAVCMKFVDFQQCLNHFKNRVFRWHKKTTTTRTHQRKEREKEFVYLFVRSFIRSFAFIVKCSLLRLSKSLSFQLIAITWFQCSLPR